MRIIYLDEPTYVTADFVARLERFGSVEIFHDRPDPATAARRLRDADIAIVEWTAITRELLDASSSRLRLIVLAPTAYDFVDLDAAERAGVVVANSPTYSARSVAEFVLGAVMAMNRHLLAAHEASSDGATHLYPPFLGRELRDLRLGLVGTGAIGVEVARLAGAVGMAVAGTRRTNARVDGIDLMGLDDLLSWADVISVQVPHTKETAGLVSATRLRLMRRGAILASVSRAAVVDVAALVALVRSGWLAGAALDDVAPSDLQMATSTAGVLVTPGCAWYTTEAREANLTEIVDTVAAFHTGTPQNVVGGTTRATEPVCPVRLDREASIEPSKGAPAGEPH